MSAIVETEEDYTLGDLTFKKSKYEDDSSKKLDITTDDMGTEDESKDLKHGLMANFKYKKNGK
jgi:hypothetical protein